MVSDDIFMVGIIFFGIDIPRRILSLIYDWVRLRAVIREQRPQEWETHQGAASTTRWIASLVFGRIKLDTPGKSYSRRLSYVRWDICLIPLDLVALLGLLAWEILRQ